MWKTIFRTVLAGSLFLGVQSLSAATTADEKQLFTVTGVDVDVTAADAVVARDKAILEAQIKAFGMLAAKLSNPEGAAMMASLTPEEVGRLMASLSVEEERSSPQRYRGKLTISFLPEKTRAAFAAKGVALAIPEPPPAPAPGSPLLLIPVWQPAGEIEVIWDENPWRRAVMGVKLDSEVAPLRLALGDTEDWAAFSSLEAANLQSVIPLLTRYQAAAAILLVAKSNEQGLTVTATAIPPITGINFEKTYPDAAESLTLAASEAAAAIEQARATAPTLLPPGSPTTVVETTVKFASPEQWGALRKNMLQAGGMRSIDLVQVIDSGARVKITYVGTLPDLQMALSNRGLNLLELESGWALEPR
jgi:hypothetical protein